MSTSRTSPLISEASSLDSATPLRAGQNPWTDVKPMPEPLTIADLFLPVRRRWLMICAFALGGAAAAVWLGMHQRPVYQAVAELEVQGFNDNFLQLKDIAVATADAMPDTYLQTQVRVLESPELLRIVAAKLDLQHDPEFRGVQNAEFLHRLSSHLKIRVPGQTRILQITAEAHEPKLAASLANTAAKEYINLTISRRLQSATEMGQALSAQLKDLKANLERSEQQLQSYGASAGLLSISETNPNGVAEENLRLAQSSASQARDERIQQQARYERVKISPIETLPDVVDDATIRNYVEKLTDLKRQNAELLTTLKPNHYRVLEVRAQIAELEAAIERARAGILGRMKNQFESALAREQLVNAAYESQKNAAAVQADKSIHYATLKREVETNRQLYESMLQNVREAGIASAVRASNVQIVSAASVPPIPARPVLPLYAGVGFIAGCFLGVCISFLRGNRGFRIRAPGDIGKRLGLPELGALPRVKLSHDAQRDEGLEQWGETVRDAVKSVLLEARSGAHPRVIAVTSCNRGDGRTMIAGAFAAALAQTGARVLLIDGDLRHPGLHAAFGIPNSPGFSSLLLKVNGPMDDVSEFAEAGPVPGLSIVPAGRDLEFASRLYSPYVPLLFRRLRRQFDAIVIDTPPISDLDSRALARIADAVILIVLSSRTSELAAMSAISQLRRDGANVIGALLNSCESSSSRMLELHRPCAQYRPVNSELGLV